MLLIMTLLACFSGSMSGNSFRQQMAEVTIEVLRDDGQVQPKFTELIQNNFGWSPAKFVIVRPDLEITYANYQEICEGRAKFSDMKIKPVGDKIDNIDLANDIFQVHVNLQWAEHLGVACSKEENFLKFTQDVKTEVEFDLIGQAIAKHLEVRVFDVSSQHVLILPVHNVETRCGTKPNQKGLIRCSYRVQVTIPANELASQTELPEKSNSAIAVAQEGSTLTKHQ